MEIVFFYNFSRTFNSISLLSQPSSVHPYVKWSIDFAVSGDFLMVAMNSTIV
jgi:hypothetical protein